MESYRHLSSRLRVCLIFSSLAVLSLGGPMAAQSGPPADAPGATLTVDLVAQAPLPLELRGRLIFTAETESARTVVVAVEAAGKVVARLAADTRWRVRFEAAGAWAPEVEITTGSSAGARQQTIPIWPAGTLRGRLRSHSDTLPEAVVLRLSSPPGTPGARALPPTELRCPAEPGEPEGAWSCHVPAVLLDLAVVPRGFVPIYRWGVAVKPGETVSLGELELVTGASLTGRVETEEGVLDPRRCRARLRPLRAPGPEQTAAKRTAAVVEEVPVLARGFFQFTAVPPGSYLLEVAQPGFAPARIFPVEMWKDRETRLRDPLLLRRPFDLTFGLSPSHDWLGEPWRVRVFRASEASAGFDENAVFQGTTDTRGEVRIPGQSAGQYWIHVADAAGNLFYSDLQVHIGGPEDATQSVEIPLIAVEGKVRLGEVPLPARIWFGGQRGAVSVDMLANEDGEFAGFLPRAGVWVVDLETVEPRLRTRLKVEVAAASDGSASVELAVPDTALFGTVVDEQGSAVAGAQIVASSELGDEVSESAEDGSFELRGLPPGTRLLGARLRRGGEAWTSPRTLAFLHENNSTGPITLRLERGHSVEGRVEGEGGPVAGAVIYAAPTRPEPGFPSTARTGVDGAFELTLPARTLVATAVVSAPGHALKAVEFPVDEAHPIFIVPQAGGFLEIELPLASEDLFAAGLEIRILQNEVMLPTPTLLQWVRGHGLPLPREGRLRIPQMAPGSYRACVGSPIGLMMLERGSPPTREISCEGGYLEAGAELHLAPTVPSAR